MADLHRRRPGPLKATTGAAKILAPTREEAPRSESWHDEAWGFRRTIGELTYAEMWLANSLSRARLVAARRPREPGGEPEPLDEGHPAAQQIARLAGGVGGQSALLRAFAPHLMTPGVGYLVGELRPGGGEDWNVYSADQLRLSRRANDDGTQLYEVIEGPDSSQDYRTLPAGSLPVKVYRPDPRFNWEPDSPVRAALPILRELRLLTQHIEASATSRLAGAGLLLMDSRIEFQDGWDAWMEEFLAAVTKPIKDRGSAAAYAPFPVKIPVPPGQKMVDLVHHLMFSTPFDEHALKLRDEAISRLATTMDMPKRALTGEQENHWGKWATTEEGITIHVKPNLDLIVDGITKGYLWPSLRVLEGRRSGQVVTRRDARDARRLQVVRNDPIVDGDDEIIVWYDTTDLQARPDRSDDTFKAYEAWEATGDDLRREAGISDARAADPRTNPDDERRLWLSLTAHPTIGPIALQKLGMLNDADVEALAPKPAAVPPRLRDDEGDDEAETEDEDEQGPPDTLDEPDPAAEEPSRAAASDGLALVAACDVLVNRALERAGNRFRNKLRRRMDAPDLNGAGSCPPTQIHTHLDIARVYARPVDELLEKAWEWAPQTAALTSTDPQWLIAQLDGYVRSLFRERREHTPYRLACWLGYGDEVSVSANGQLVEAVPA